MPFDPNQFTEGTSYEASITAAAMTASDSGTPGLYLKAATPNGEIEGTIWLTVNTRERAQRTLNDLGIADEQLAGEAFWEDPGSALIGVECAIVPEINTYEGKDSWRVKWWNRRRKAASAETKAKAAGLFRGAVGAVAMPMGPDVPF